MLASIDDDRTINLEQHTVFDVNKMWMLLGWWLDTRVPDR